MKKVLVMFLLICLLLPIASCIGGGGGSEPTTTTKDENSCGGWPPPPPPTEGYVYKGYVSWNGMAMAYRSDDLAWLYSDTPDKDSISASVYYRNQAIQSARGCTVIDRAQTMDSVYEEWSSFQNNGEKFEVAVMGAKTSALLAADGYLHDLDIIAEYTKGSIEDEIFDQNSVKELEINDHLYYVAGDMNLSPFNNSPATVFNVDLFSEWKNTITEELGDGYGDLYKMVEDGTWTLEAMLSIADLVTYDVVTNDGALSYEKGDTIGYFAYSASPVFHWFGEGMRIARQIDGEITMDGVCNTIKAGQTYNALFEIFNQPVAGSTIPMGDSGDRREEFNSGNVLFADYIVGDIRHQLYPDDEVEYGILPIAKQSQGQKGYRSLVYFQADHAVLWSIPKMCANVAFAAQLFYDMAEFSGGGYGYESLKDACFSRTVSRKATNNEGSLKSLEIIRTSLVYDYGVLYDEWLEMDRFLRRTRTAEESEFDTHINYETMTEALAQMKESLKKFQ